MPSHESAEKQLRQQHREMLSIASEIRGMARAGPADLTSNLAPLRIRFANAVRLHLADEQRLLFDYLKGPLRNRVPALDAILERAREMRLDYSRHVQVWNAKAIDADPAGYAAALDRVVGNLEQQIILEERDLFAPAFAMLRSLPIAC